MYNLPHFKEKDERVLLQFMRDHPFIFLAGVDKNALVTATQVPVFIDKRGDRLYLNGHIMKNSDHHKAFLHHPDVLAVFTGPHTYVSATWYDDPHQASTWNYMSVHARGKISFGTDESLMEVLKRLTLHYENNDPASTTVFDNLPSEYRERLMKGIVSFEIEVTAIENVFKLSQNRNEKSFRNIIAKLHDQGGDARKISEEMANRIDQLFPQ